MDLGELFNDPIGVDPDDPGIAPADFLLDPFAACSLFGDLDSSMSVPDGFMEVMPINPASGLPMIGGIGGVDVAGNPWGTTSDEDFGAAVSPSMNCFDDD